jgi:hypothetical protein
MKFNEFVKGQKLASLSKLLLNNAVQDPSFLHEHMAYELARKAGAAAPLTAHGIVTFNGQPYGLYVVREAINDDFMERNYGKENQGGNLYETGDFIEDPNSPELKDEVEEMRTRDDVREVSRVVKTTPDAQWVAAISAKLDIPSFLAGWAVEALVDHWDGYFFGPTTTTSTTTRHEALHLPRRGHGRRLQPRPPLQRQHPGPPRHKAPAIPRDEDALRASSRHRAHAEPRGAQHADGPGGAHHPLVRARRQNARATTTRASTTLAPR